MLQRGIESGIVFLPVGTTFTDDNRDFLIHKVRLELVELHLNAVGIGPSVCGSAGEIPWVIVVNFNHQAVSLGVIGHLKIAASGVNVSRWTLNHQHTRRIIASRGPHGVHESLIIPLQYRGQRLVMAVEELVFLERFVESCKENMLIIVFESKGDVGPKPLQLRCFRRDGGLIYSLEMVAGAAEAVHFEPSSVPMVVDNHVKTVSNAIVHNLFHAV